MVRQITITWCVQNNVFPILLSCSQVIYPGSPGIVLKSLFQRLSIISRVSFLPLIELFLNLCGQRLCEYEKSNHKFLFDPLHPLHNYRSKGRSDISTRSHFRSILFWISVYGNSTVRCLARILLYRQRVLAKFPGELSKGAPIIPGRFFQLFTRWWVWMFFF